MYFFGEQDSASCHASKIICSPFFPCKCCVNCNGIFFFFYCYQCPPLLQQGPLRCRNGVKKKGRKRRENALAAISEHVSSSSQLVPCIENELLGSFVVMGLAELFCCCVAPKRWVVSSMFQKLSRQNMSK